MPRDNDDPAAGVPQLHVTAALSHNRESALP